MLNFAGALAANEGFMHVSDYLRKEYAFLAADPAVEEHGLLNPYLTMGDKAPPTGRWALVAEYFVKKVAAAPSFAEFFFRVQEEEEEEEEEDEAKAAEEKLRYLAFKKLGLEGCENEEEFAKSKKAIKARQREIVELSRVVFKKEKKAAEEKAEAEAKVAEEKAREAEDSLLADLDAEDAKAAKKKESNKKKKEKKKEKAKGKGKEKGKDEQEGEEEEMAGGVAALAGGMGGLAVADEGEGEEEDGDDRKLAAPAPQEGKKGEEEEQEQEEEEDDEYDFMLAGAPNEYLCPISLTLMTDPVFCADGHTYERAAIEAWFAKCVAKQQPISSPRTGEEMEQFLMPNKMARALICDYVDRRRGEWVQLRQGKKLKEQQQGGKKKK